MTYETIGEYYEDGSYGMILDTIEENTSQKFFEMFKRQKATLQGFGDLFDEFLSVHNEWEEDQCSCRILSIFWDWHDYRDCEGMTTNGSQPFRETDLC